MYKDIIFTPIPCDAVAQGALLVAFSRRHGFNVGSGKIIFYDFYLSCMYTYIRNIVVIAQISHPVDKKYLLTVVLNIILEGTADLC